MLALDDVARGTRQPRSGRLIPELQKDGSLLGLVSQVASMWVGIALMAALTLFE